MVKRIIGCGNLLLRDEGVGVHLVKSLEGEKLPPGVELIDGACGGFDLLTFFEDADKVVIVDTVKAPGGVPGAVYRFTPDDFQTEEFPKTSLHDVSLHDIFSIVRQTSRKMPEIVIFGVEPLDMDWGMELTEPVAKQLPKLRELVLKEMRDA